MGNNSAFTAFEETVVGAFKLGKLDKPLLTVLMLPYRDCDIDSGGKNGLTAKDSQGRIMEVEDIVIFVMTGKYIQRPKLPKDYAKWTPEQEALNGKHHEERDGEFRKITDEIGW